MHIEYNKIYLVGINQARHGKHRVTTREPHKRPATVQFTGQFLMPDGVTSYGTLVLTEELWEEWFGDREMLPLTVTAEQAAAYFVKTFPGVYYGCPLCAATFQTYVEAQDHIQKHLAKFLTQFDITEEYTCPICGKVYQRAGALKNHIEKYIEKQLEVKDGKTKQK